MIYDIVEIFISKVKTKLLIRMVDITHYLPYEESFTVLLMAVNSAIIFGERTEHLKYKTELDCKVGVAEFERVTRKMCWSCS